MNEQSAARGTSTISQNRSKTGMRRRNNEAEEQEALFRWAAWAAKQTPALELLFHVPNGGRRDPAEAAHLKRQGVRAGVTDICLPVARGGCLGLFIEIKTEGGRASAEQKAWLERLRLEDYKAEICVGWMEAVRVICGYLGIKPPEIVR